MIISLLMPIHIMCLQLFGERRLKYHEIRNFLRKVRRDHLININYARTTIEQGYQRRSKTIHHSIASSLVQLVPRLISIRKKLKKLDRGNLSEEIMKNWIERYLASQVHVEVSGKIANSVEGHA